MLPKCQNLRSSQECVTYCQSEGGDSTERLITFLGARMVEGLFPGEALSPVVVVVAATVLGRVCVRGGWVGGLIRIIIEIIK